MSDFRALNALEAMMDAVYVTLQTLFSTVNEFVPSQIIIVRQDQQLFRPAADEKDDETADVRLLVLIDWIFLTRQIKNAPVYKSTNKYKYWKINTHKTQYNKL